MFLFKFRCERCGRPVRTRKEYLFLFGRCAPCLPPPASMRPVKTTTGRTPHGPTGDEPMNEIITDHEIETLRDLADDHGDAVLSYLCTRALRGSLYPKSRAAVESPVLAMREENEREQDTED